MNSRHRDGLLALVVGGGLLAVASATGLRAADLLRPTALAFGCAGALGLELLMARFPERSIALWERRSVRVGSALLVVGGGGLLATTAGGWAVAALCGGLATYFVLLALVLSGVVPGPETWFREE
ncbi:hypothetical protein SAMN04487949_1314 [Halogranum gelatinilyticum]|uniref:Uncharacterized protein n=1 Tax=Halogranum gelatinilyticum TaxID=660521 RepID=A0A1G9RFC0_9EURY|nr:hypothetical protein [Halogranum gelatinilyticum]SDM21871.1 hypothetical protein SAMN04487949_1314 [Halogranum gelatinilyticum]